MLKIRVIEAEYGKVLLNNSSRALGGSLQSLLNPLQSGMPIEEDTLDRVLLLLSDVPGAQVGTSDLTVNTTPGPQVAGSVTADNYGNDYTGNGRLGGAVTVNELLGLGDQLSANGLTSGPGMNYARLGYDLLANGSGTRAYCHQCQSLPGWIQRSDLEWGGGGDELDQWWGVAGEGICGEPAGVGPDPTGGEPGGYPCLGRIISGVLARPTIA